MTIRIDRLSVLRGARLRPRIGKPTYSRDTDLSDSASQIDPSVVALPFWTKRRNSVWHASSTRNSLIRSLGARSAQITTWIATLLSSPRIQAIQASTLNSYQLSALGNPFTGNILIGTREEATERASIEYRFSDLFLSSKKLVFWTDASVRHLQHTNFDDVAGISIVWKSGTSPRQWKQRTYKTRGYLSVNEAEFSAINEALKLALSQCKNSFTHDPGAKIASVYIYTDSQESLSQIRDTHSIDMFPLESVQHKQMPLLKANAQELRDLGVRLFLCWIPGHAFVEGNELADQFAKRTRRSKILVRLSSYYAGVLDFGRSGPCEQGNISRKKRKAEKARLREIEQQQAEIKRRELWCMKTGLGLLTTPTAPTKSRMNRNRSPTLAITNEVEHSPTPNRSVQRNSYASLGARMAFLRSINGTARP